MSASAGIPERVPFRREIDFCITRGSRIDDDRIIPVVNGEMTEVVMIVRFLVVSGFQCGGETGCTQDCQPVCSGQSNRAESVSLSSSPHPR